MKSLLSLFNVVAEDLATSLYISIQRDLRKVASRVDSEGMSFLTITLPAFGRSFESALEAGAVCAGTFPGFAGNSAGLPRFLGGFLARIFDTSSGKILDDPDVDCIFAVRQLCYLLQKIELPCTDTRLARAMDGYIECDSHVARWNSTADPDLLVLLSEATDVLFGRPLNLVERAVEDGDIIMGHGPGATADRLRGNAKWDQKLWTDRLESVFPAHEHLRANFRSWSELIDETTWLEPTKEPPVKVVAVPKTLKTPRIIAEEPTCMQYAQQGVSRVLVRELERLDNRTSSGWPVLGFQDQSINRDLARRGSLDGSFATLDLSEASDRVSIVHVRAMLRNYPALLSAVEASRSTRARVTVRGVSTEIQLAKFASMGSALTFPIEAMAFAAMALVGIARRDSCRPARAFKVLDGRMRVYGDDILVPVDHVPCVIDSLESFGMKVNSSKSFWNGRFRESCGGDYYAGTDVTPVRVRQVLPVDRSEARKVASMVALRNNLYHRGLWKAAAWLDCRIISLLGNFPKVLPESQVLGRHSFLGFDWESSDLETQSPLVRGWVLEAPTPPSPLDGEGALLKSLLLVGRDATDPQHLDAAGRPVSFRLKRRWKSPV